MVWDTPVSHLKPVVLTDSELLMVCSSWLAWDSFPEKAGQCPAGAHLVILKTYLFHLQFPKAICQLWLPNKSCTTILCSKSLKNWALGGLVANSEQVRRKHCSLRTASLLLLGMRTWLRTQHKGISSTSCSLLVSSNNNKQGQSTRH